MYAEGIKDALICMGHKCELLYFDHREVLCRVRVVVVEEEIKRGDANEEPQLSPGAESEAFVQEFFLKNEVPLNRQLGMADGPPVKFLAGILVATSTSLLQVPHLQDVIQVDAAHISFGKFTLFSAYATTL